MEKKEHFHCTIRTKKCNNLHNSPTTQFLDPNIIKQKKFNNFNSYKMDIKTEQTFTTLRLDLEAIGNDLLEAFKWIRAQISLVQTKTMNMVLTAKPITVITKLIPEEIIAQKKKSKSNPQFSELTNSPHQFSEMGHRKGMWNWSGFGIVATKNHAFLLLGLDGKWIRMWVCQECENWKCCIVTVTERMETLKIEGMIMMMMMVAVAREVNESETVWERNQFLILIGKRNE